MIVRKIALLAGAAALMSTPAWALPSQAPSNQGTGHHGSGHGAGDQGANGNSHGNGGANRPNHPEHPEHPAHPGHPEHPKHPGHPEHPKHPGHTSHPKAPENPGHHGNSHKCLPHNVAYVTAGTLVSQTLTKNADGTYSGEVVVDVKRTNRHAHADLGQTVYKVLDVRVRFDLADTDSDGSVGPDEVVAGDRVRVIGRITTLARRCNQSGFSATKTIRQIVFHAPVRGHASAAS